MTPAELKKRRKYLGGSEIAAVRGHSPFTTPAQLWDEKMGLVAPKETSDAMEFGIFLEDGIAKLWAHRWAAKHGRHYRMAKHRPLCHPVHRFMRASPDRIIQSWILDRHVGDMDNRREGLEIKCISKFSEAAGGWGRSGSQDYPIYYKDQCAWNAIIFDLPVWNLVALVADGRYSLKHYVYKRDPVYEAQLIQDGLNFWNNHILAKVRPPESEPHRLTSPDAQDIVSVLPAIAPAWMTGEAPTQYATTLPKEEE